jgi:aconitate hydratase
MMGILPLQFMPGENAESLGLTGREEYSITGVDNGNSDEVTVRADDKEFRARVRLDTPREREYFQHGGILPYVLRRLLAS